MSETDDLKADVAQLRAQTAELAAQVAKLVEAAKPSEPMTREPHQPLDLTARATMPPQAMRDLVAAVPDRLMSDLRADARKPNPVTQSVAQLTKGGGSACKSNPAQAGLTQTL